jgi:ubiquinone/menaquinone biosynthesis C-methylase UbiE
MSNIIKLILKKIIPQRQRSWLRQKLTARPISKNTYESLYESYAQQNKSDHVIGPGDFNHIGQIELDLLLMEGLQPEHTLLDLGCGIGRLAVHVIPRLLGGSYIGVDISKTMLKRAKERIQQAIPEPPCRITWMQQATSDFQLPDHSVDMICAFSVFTHMEHEDSYRYLRDSLRIVRPGGRFIFSCAPLSLAMGKEMFRNSADLDMRTRWSYVRNVTTTVDYMTEIAKLAGWTVSRWYAGDEANIGLPSNGKLHALGQSSCVLEAPASPVASS